MRIQIQIQGCSWVMAGLVERCIFKPGLTLVTQARTARAASAKPEPIHLGTWANLLIIYSKEKKNIYITIPKDPSMVHFSYLDYWP